MKSLPKVVLLAGIASFLTDMSTEMIYPLLPVFLTATLGATPLALGLIEGIAETTAAVLKIFSGIWSDRLPRRKPLVLFGYGISGLTRPLIGLATGWGHVLVIRFLDRVGKGLRSSPRDALIADAVPANRRGAAFGFHRMMDNAGAVFGPIIAWALLAFGLDMRTVFLCAFIPGIFVMLTLILLPREDARAVPAKADRIDFRHGWKRLGPRFQYLLLAVFVFALGMSADAFILMRFTQVGFSGGAVALLWSLHQAVKAVASYGGGALSDLFGRRRLVLIGWAIYAAVYIAFAFITTPALLIAIFLVYGLYFGLVEPSERAWAADLAPKALRGTALGYYNGAVGLASLPADLLFGLVWYQFGPAAAFLMGACFAALGALLLTFVRTDAPPKSPLEPTLAEGEA